MQRVLLTGWSEWLGYAIWELLIEQGIEVICLSRKKPNLKVIHLPTDLRDELSIQESINKIKWQYMLFDALINCAWVLEIQWLWSVDYKKTSDVFAVNVIAPLILCSWLIDVIIWNEADIVNIGSTVWFKAYPSQAAYGASKRALRWLNENLQLELKNTTSRVIGCNPGWFQSTIFQKATGVVNDLSWYMDPKELAKIVYYALSLPKNMEISEIIINRK